MPSQSLKCPKWLDYNTNQQKKKYCSKCHCLQKKTLAGLGLEMQTYEGKALFCLLQLRPSSHSIWLIQQLGEMSNCVNELIRNKQLMSKFSCQNVFITLTC